MRVEKLPFTIYDIVGYFLPGAVLLASIIAALFPDVVANLYSSGIAIKIPIYGWIVIGVLSVTVSYALGYCIALISSEGIEEAVIKTFGYPSEFLVYGPCGPKDPCQNNVPRIRKIIRKMFLLHSVLASCCWLREEFESTFVKELAEPTNDMLRKRVKNEFKMRIKRNHGDKWFSLVRHYVVNNNEQAFARLYNYMTLYGFCRNLSAALYVSAIILSLGFILPSILMPFNRSWLDLSGSVAFRICIVIPLMFPLSLALALNFAKFYRRYSHETILAFVTMKDEAKEDRSPAKPQSL